MIYMKKEIFVTKDSQKMGINEMFPNFSLQSVSKEEVSLFSLQENLGKWIILFFYPSDFSLTSSSEIKDLNFHKDKFSELNCQPLVIGTDSLASHRVWMQSDKNLQENSIPFLTDSFFMLSKILGLLDKKNGSIVRATYIIDPEGVLRFFEKGDPSITRSIPDLIRKIEAMQAVEKIKMR